jgi:hypothetical protein
MPVVDTVFGPSFASQEAQYARRHRDWDRTPAFKTVPQWALPINTYFDIRDQPFQRLFTGQVRTYDDGTIVYDYPPGRYTHTGNDLMGEFNSAYDDFGFAQFAQGVYEETYRALLIKAADVKVNLPVMAAEAAKTSSLITDAATRVYTAMRALRKGNLKQVAKSLNLTPGTAHKSWLEYKYGWMPLLMDIEGSAAAFAQGMNDGRFSRFTVSKKGHDTMSESDERAYPAYGGDYVVVTRSFDASYDCHLKMWCEVDCAFTSSLQQLGLTNPALVVWELVPYSFVFDWIYSVGDYLQSMSALQGIKVLRSMESNVNEFNYLWKQPATTFIPVGGGVSMKQGLRDRGYVGRHYHRGHMAVTPPELPRLRTPGSFSKLLTSLALLRGNARNLRV